MKVVFFADAGPRIGMGHATRSLVLASELAPFVESTVVVGSWVSRAQRYDASFQRVPVSETTGAVSFRDTLPQLTTQDLAIVDGYHYSADFFRFLEELSVKYGIIDDNLESSAPAPRFVINHGLHSSFRDYRERWPDSLHLLGGHYSLIRDGIRRLMDETVDRKEHVVVALGGTDPLGRSAAVATCLAKMRFQPRVYLGEQCESLRDQKALLAASGLKLHDPEDGLENALAEAKFAVVGAGTLLWETLSLGTLVIPTISAENQVGPAESTVARGLAPALLDLRASQNTIAEALERGVDALERFGAVPGNPFQSRGQKNVVSTLFRHRIISP